MVMNISCKFEKASYNIFLVRAVMVKSLYTLRWWRNEAKSIASKQLLIKVLYHLFPQITQLKFNL